MTLSCSSSDTAVILQSKASVALSAGACSLVEFAVSHFLEALSVEQVVSGVAFQAASVGACSETSDVGFNLDGVGEQGSEALGVQILGRGLGRSSGLLRFSVDHDGDGALSLGHGVLIFLNQFSGGHHIILFGHDGGSDGLGLRVAEDLGGGEDAGGSFESTG